MTQPKRLWFAITVLFSATLFVSGCTPSETPATPSDGQSTTSGTDDSGPEDSGPDGTSSDDTSGTDGGTDDSATTGNENADTTDADSASDTTTDAGETEVTTGTPSTGVNPAPPRDTGDLKVARLPMRTDGPRTLDPIRGSTTYDNSACSMIFETLLEYEYLQRPTDATTLRPLLLAEMPTAPG